jgi:2-polyprenyl-3-methyl-5-hydroxy-6-metoxy-1,4-benzoquinol methylase
LLTPAYEELSFRITLEDKRRALAYYSGLARDYEGFVSRGPLRWLRQLEREAVLTLSGLAQPTCQGKTLLDAGCGAGFYSLFAKSRGVQVTAMDAVPAFVERLAAQVDSCWVGDIEQTAPDVQYDIVICAGVLDFVVSAQRAFDNLCRHVAPNGRLVLLVPRAGPCGWAYRLEKRIAGMKVNLFSPRWLEAQARSHGLVPAGLLRPLPTNMAAAFQRP